VRWLPEVPRNAQTPGFPAEREPAGTNRRVQADKRREARGDTQKNAPGRAVALITRD